MVRCFVLSVLIAVYGAMPATAQTGAPIWAIDLVKVKPGERDHYIAFVRANWRVARQDALEHKTILSYRMVIVEKSSPAAAAQPDVILMTQYRNAADYADREKIFAPILARHPLVRVDGRTSRDFVASMDAVSGASPDK